MTAALSASACSWCPGSLALDIISIVRASWIPVVGNYVPFFRKALDRIDLAHARVRALAVCLWGSIETPSTPYIYIYIYMGRHVWLSPLQSSRSRPSKAVISTSVKVRFRKGDACGMPGESCNVCCVSKFEHLPGVLRRYRCLQKRQVLRAYTS